MPRSMVPETGTDCSGLQTLFRGMEDVVWFAESTFTEEEFVEREGVTDPLAKKLIAGVRFSLMASPSSLL